MICSLNSYRKGCPGSIQPWLSLRHFVGCCWVGRDRSSFNGGALDPSRLKGESVVFVGRARRSAAQLGEFCHTPFDWGAGFPRLAKCLPFEIVGGARLFSTL